MLVIDTPAYIQHADHFQNGTQVRGGTNYDISRGGVSTPVVLLKEKPAPVEAAPALTAEEALLSRWGVAPDAERVHLNVRGKHKKLDASALNSLKTLSAGGRLVVIAWTDGTQRADLQARAALKAVLKQFPKDAQVKRSAVLSRAEAADAAGSQQIQLTAYAAQ